MQGAFKTYHRALVPQFQVHWYLPALQLCGFLDRNMCIIVISLKSAKGWPNTDNSQPTNAQGPILSASSALGMGSAGLGMLLGPQANLLVIDPVCSRSGHRSQKG